MNTSSDISTRTQVYADRRFLERAKPNNVLAMFGEVRPIPMNKTDTISIRRYEKLAAATMPITEGVTPTGSSPTYTDYSAKLDQYGDYIRYSDRIMDTHEDPLLNEFTDLLGEQAPETFDLIYAGILKAGTNIFYSGIGTARTEVVDPITNTMLDRIDRALSAQEAKPIKSIIEAGPNISTRSVGASFVVVVHSDFKMDLKKMEDWTPIEQYASNKGLIPGEIGAVGNFRFVVDNNLTAYEDAGGAAGSMISTTGVSADVYPFLVFGQKAYATVPLGGKGSVQVLVANPKANAATDPLAQKGSIGWKGYTTAVITNDLWMAVGEAAATD